MISVSDGGVFPADLLVGQVVLGPDRRLRVRLAADYERLEFLRVLRNQPREAISDQGRLLTPFTSPQTPAEQDGGGDG